MIVKTVFSFGICLVFLATAAPAQQSQGNPSSNAFYHGTIGRTLEVQMTLTRRGSELTGSCEYQTQRKPITLRGRVLASGAYEIDELDARGQPAATFSLNQVFARHPAESRNLLSRRGVSQTVWSAGSRLGLLHPFAGFWRTPV